MQTKLVAVIALKDGFMVESDRTSQFCKKGERYPAEKGKVGWVVIHTLVSEHHHWSLGKDDPFNEYFKPVYRVEV